MRPADRLDEDRSVDPFRRLRLGGQVRHREVVLLCVGDAVDSVAVERVERRAPQPLRDTDRHVEVVGELGGTRGPGYEAAVAARHVAREEVQAHEPHARVRDGTDELVHGAVCRHRYVERPPVLDGVEPRPCRGRGALEHAELGEQDRQVHVVARCARCCLGHCRLLYFRYTETLFRTTTVQRGGEPVNGRRRPRGCHPTGERFTMEPAVDSRPDRFYGLC
jgi:hypothetical protein